MPKAVASVTSVPTRADYQQQLEANLERKRKREKGEHGHEAAIPDKGKKGKKGKKVDESGEEKPLRPGYLFGEISIVYNCLTTATE